MVESLTVATLENHEDTGSELSGSVQRWLDFEWMPQELHHKFGESCKASYIRCREAGTDDMMAILTTIVDDLNERWDEYNAEAFVNAWDIGNYATDFLTSKLDIDGCQCTSAIH